MSISYHKSTVHPLVLDMPNVCNREKRAISLLTYYYASRAFSRAIEYKYIVIRNYLTALYRWLSDTMHKRRLEELFRNRRLICYYPKRLTFFYNDYLFKTEIIKISFIFCGLERQSIQEDLVDKSRDARSMNVSCYVRLEMSRDL